MMAKKPKSVKDVQDEMMSTEEGAVQLVDESVNQNDVVDNDLNKSAGVKPEKGVETAPDVKVKEKKVTEKVTGTKTSESVMVCLNHPSGINFILSNGQRVLINGNAVDLRGKEKGVLPVGTYGFTTVKTNVWDEIKRMYGNMEVFKSGLIFAQNSKASAFDQAEDCAELRHGREAVDTSSTQTKEGSAEG